MNLYPVTIIHDFYENPNQIRDFALKQEFKFCHELKDINYVFPGSRTKDLFVLNPKLFETVCKKLVSIFHIPSFDLMRWVITSSFQIVGEEYERGLIHQDSNTIFAGVLYLSPDAPLDSGTSLYQTNRFFNEALYKSIISENDKRFKNKEPIDFSYHRMFDEVVKVNNIYNSLILFEGDMYHSANRFFGKNKLDSRLAQVFFISRIDANKEDSFPMKRLRKNEISVM